MTDCCFATKNLAHIHKRKSVFLPLTHKSLLLNRGVGQRMEGVTFRSSPWDGMEAKHTPYVRIIGIFWSPAACTQIFGWFVSGFPKKKILPIPKEILYLSSSSGIEGSRHVKGLSRCHFFWKLPPLDKFGKKIHRWRCQMLRSSAVVKLQEIGK